jgi:hypothetical protein
VEGLQTTFGELREQLGFYLGFGINPDNWDADQVATVKMTIKSGLRRFLFSPLIPGSRKTWEWSFLRRSLSLTTTSDIGEYPLPEDFGAPTGPMYYTEDYRTSIPFFNEAMLRSHETDPAVTGPPKMAAIVPRNPTIAAPRYSLLLHPTPDGVYSFRLLYQVLPDMLSEQLTNPNGGAPHARTLLYACLVEAGTLVDDDHETYEKKYHESLMASIDYDRSLKGSDLGYMGDGPLLEKHIPNFHVTYDGTLYTE